VGRVSNSTDYTMSSMALGMLSRGGAEGQAHRQDFSAAILTLRGSKVI